MATCPSCRKDYDAGTFCPRDGTRLVGGNEAPVLGGRYRLHRKVGEGGMGEVYEAEHVYIHRRVAVKILKREIASDPQAVERLQREAQSTSGLGHPNIVDTLDFGYSDEGQVYLVMEWLEGENLDERMQREPLDTPTALDIAAQAAAGLAEAHEHGVIHRDLKPANVFLTRDRKGALVVKVLDFGIAKLASHQTKLTGTGVLVGTPNYMAPEQAFGEAVDARTDVYALGVILYEMVTGEVPFHADSPLGVLHQHTSRLPVPPSTRAPDRGISPELEHVVMRCLSKRADDRYASMHEVIEAIDALRRGATSPVPAPASRPDREPEVDDDLLQAAGVGRRRTVPLVIAGALILLGGGVALALALRGQPDGKAPAATPDASHVATRTPDAGADAAPRAIDAAVASPPVDAAPSWSQSGRGDRFAYVVTAPAEPRPGRSPVTFSLSDLDQPLQHALGDGDLRVLLELAYFKDHSVVHESKHSLDASLRFEVEVEIRLPGKHHVHLQLLDKRRRVAEARFDIVIR